MSVKPAAVTKIAGDDENLRGSNKKQQNPSKMYVVGREICFVLAIIFTTYAAVLNTNQTNSKGPPPAPFFRKGSLVTDYYSGELRTLLKKAAQVELMFVMYYAPWDAESQSLRKEFEIAADHHHEQVFFAAINCWQPGSECRSQASKIPILIYPEFIAYPLQGSPVGYEGHRLAGHMIKFIDTLLHPLHRIENPHELDVLKIRYEAVVVGCVEFINMRGGVEYKAIYEAAFRMPERNMKGIGFAIVTNQIAAANIGLKMIPSVSLHLWNEVKEYSGPWKSEALSQWILQNINVVSSWISPPGVKSLTFKPFVDVGSVLIMFAPENPLLSHTNVYDALREVGLVYNNCKNNTYLEDFISRFSKTKLQMDKNEESIFATCQRRKKSIVSSVKSKENNFNIPLQIVENVWINTSSNGLKSRKRIQTVPSWSDPTGTSEPSVTTCASSQTFAGTADSSFPKLGSKLISSMPISNEDYRSAASLMSWKFIAKCHHYYRAVSFSMPTVLNQQTTAVPEPSEYIPEFVGLACKSNLTLSLLAMDSNIYEHFADGLGIDLNVHPDKIAVVIFNADQESVYVMGKKPITIKNLQEFILNYSNGSIERHLRSDTRSSLPPNRYQQSTSRRSVKKNDASSSSSTSQSFFSSVSLVELNSRTFLSLALNESQNVIVFYHSPYCAFCHGVSHVYLTVAHLLRNINNLIFARIDGENNDLPWEFTVHHYPSILFLPAYRKSESRVFPQKLPLTVDNLSKFILANLNMETKLHSMIELCLRWNSKQLNMKKQHECLLGVRQACLNMIAETLKEYRAISRLNLQPKYKKKTLQRLLKRLHSLKDIHLQLGASNIRSATELIQEYYSSLISSRDNDVDEIISNKETKGNYFIKDEL